MGACWRQASGSPTASCCLVGKSAFGGSDTRLKPSRCPTPLLRRPPGRSLALSPSTLDRRVCVKWGSCLCPAPLRSRDGEYGFRIAHGPPHPPSPQGQNGDSHHCGDRLPLPVRSRKYQEGLDTAERRPREGSHSPLDSADVRVQVPRMVGSFLGSNGAPGGPPPPIRGGRSGRPLQGAGITALAVPWGLVGTGPADSPGHSVQGQCLIVSCIWPQ